MKHAHKLYQSLFKQYKLHKQDVINYTIPQSWNTFGFSHTKILRNHEMILHPYEFYCFALKEILDTPKSSHKDTLDDDWLKKSITYVMDLRTFSSWDHDRSGDMETQNMYHLSDQGTFLKTIILLPLLKRAGMNTLVLHNYLTLDTSDGKHDFADPHASINLRDINPFLFDPMLPELSLKEQMQAFIEVCHHLGMHVILNFAPALCAQHSSYVEEHPQWFYWIDKEHLQTYHTPQTSILPLGCLPSPQVCRILYDSEDVKHHISMFVQPPKLSNLATSLPPHELHQTIKKDYGCVVAPLISDQINAQTKPDTTCTLLRFYEDLPTYCPKEYKAPYMLCDTMRCDLFPGKKKMTSLWKEIKDVISMWLHDFDIDGFYLTKTYLLPDALLKEMVTVLHKEKKHAKFLLEYMDERNFNHYQALGFDAVSGNSAYRIHDVYDYQYHNFAYSLITSPLPQFAASEFLDTPRICAYEQGEVLSQLLSIMNLFLPNALPYFMGGQLSLEKQPQYLSQFADQNHLNVLDKNDPQYRKQAMLDQYRYDYTRRDFHVLINHLEKFTAIRSTFIDAIKDIHQCTPLCFDTPKDMGIGFAYTLVDKALLVVCNTNIHNDTSLRIHLENLLWKLPFSYQSVRQIYSNDNPFTHDIFIDTQNGIQLDFAPGEVKCIELSM